MYLDWWPAHDMETINGWLEGWSI